MATPSEIEAMRYAIALSAPGVATAGPNPAVGCVILDANQRIVGTGYHQRKGEAHAETQALCAAGERAHGGTAVVTLEPCNHVGVTPACRQALLDAAIRRVVIALMDPTSRGRGGAAVLQAAGVDVETGVLADEARLVLGPWLAATIRKRPIITWAYRYLEGRLLLPDNIDELRIRFDTVILPDGSVEEGIRGGHGADHFGLPESPLQPGVDGALKTLFDRGTRTVLVVGDSPLFRAFPAADTVDTVVVELPLDFGRMVHGRSTPILPSGFALERVEPQRHALRLIARHHAEAASASSAIGWDCGRPGPMFGLSSNVSRPALSCTTTDMVVLE